MAQSDASENTHYYTVTSATGPVTAVSAAAAKGPTKVVVMPSGKAKKGQAAANAGNVMTTLIQMPSTSTSGATTIEVPADALQLMASNNLFVTYPHTTWEKDNDGNRIQIIKQEQLSSSDLLSQATATIKQEGGQQVTVLRLGGQNKQQVSHQLLEADEEEAELDEDNLIRPHLCDICQKGFVKREHLTKHLRIHKSDNKRYACEYCQKAFRDRYELVRHTRRHTGDFPFR
jgi:uncharacterized Zn-finger protein